MSTITQTTSLIRKRDGSKVEFDSFKITEAVSNAFHSVGDDINPDQKSAKFITEKVIKKLQMNDSVDLSSVEQIQDLVEMVLLENNYSEVAKSYILYRHEKRKIREEKMKVLNLKNLDDVSKKFDLNCLRVLASRYLFRNSKNEIIETPTQMFERVAIIVGIGDILHDNDLFEKNGLYKQDLNEAKSYLDKLDAFDYKFKIGKYYFNKYHFRSFINLYINLADQGCMKHDIKTTLSMILSEDFKKYENTITEYFHLMTEQIFLPNSPTMMNAGGRLGQLSACFVLDMKDGMEEIMKSTSDAALIFKSGGGVGINYSDLREEGDMVASTSGVASGPVSFMNIINTVTDVIKQGGKRRGANMGIIDSWHPDVEKFITNKTNPGILENFNISVGIWEDFWDALVNSESGNYTLRSPHTNQPVKEINAHQLADLIAMSAWKSAEPGLIFFDQINKHNVFGNARGGPIRATNPCGEQGLYPYESCNLGSINLAKIVRYVTYDNEIIIKFDWDEYERIIRITTRFLDNIIDVNNYPIPEITKASLESRRIGLGVMGVADLLYKLKIPYNSKEGYLMQEYLSEFLSYISMDESIKLSLERGEFPLYSKTDYPEGKIPIAGYYEPCNSKCDWGNLVENIKTFGIRNVLTTTVAPTGTLSMIADCSNGMEPTFALAFEKHVTVGKFVYMNKILEERLKELGLYTDEIIDKIAKNYGSVKGIDEIPEEIQKVFVTAMDIHWADHLMAQSVWQKWIGNAIAKTINMPYDVTAEDIKAAYLLAHELGLKGITVYRDGSRHTQVLHMTNKNAKKIFSVELGEYVQEYIKENITNNYVKSHVMAAITSTPCEAIPAESVELEYSVPVPKKDNSKICPNCSNKLVFSEGCHVCVECGHTGCTSG